MVTALFIAAFITAMIYKDSYQATIAADLKKVYGAYSGIIYDADSEKINLNAEKIKNSNSGIVYGANKVISENDKDIYIGYIDSNAMELCSISLKEGRLPESDNEIAIENNTYERLFLTAQVGEKVIISVNENGNAIEKEYTLVGILNDYVSNWQRYDSSKKSELFPPPSLLSTKNEDSIKYANVICADSSIKNVVVNDFSRILETADIRQIFCNGGKSYSLYHKYCEPVTRRKAIQLSSSSPANAGTNLEKLIEKWKVILPYLEE